MVSPLELLGGLQFQNRMAKTFIVYWYIFRNIYIASICRRPLTKVLGPSMFVLDFTACLIPNLFFNIVAIFPLDISLFESMHRITFPPCRKHVSSNIYISLLKFKLGHRVSPLWKYYLRCWAYNVLRPLSLDFLTSWYAVMILIFLSPGLCSVMLDHLPRFVGSLYSITFNEETKCL